jgi:hypothetical protein
MKLTNNQKKILYDWWLGTTSFPLQEESTAFFDRMVVLGEPVPDAYKTRYNNTIYWLKNTFGIDGVTSYWNSLDVVQIRSTYSKIAAMQNLKTGVFGNSTIQNGDYAGSFVIDIGLKGNGTDFRLLSGYNPFDLARTYNYKSNNACWGLGLLTDEAGEFYDMWATSLSPSNAGTFIRPRATLANGYSFQTYPSATVRPSAYAYGSVAVKQDPSFHKSYVNGMVINRQVSIPSNFGGSTEFKEFAFFTTATGWGGHSNKYHSHWYAGSNNISPSVMDGVLYKYFYKTLSANNAKVGKRIMLVGDGRTAWGNYSAGIEQYSATMEVFRRSIFQLNGGEFAYNGWVGACHGIPNRKLSDIITDMPFTTVENRGSFFDQDIVVTWSITSDVEFDVGLTVNDAYARLQTWEAAHRIFPKCVIIGPCGIGFPSYPSGKTTAEVSQFMIDINETMKDEYTIPTSIANVYRNSHGSYYCDLLAVPALVDYSNPTYFHADLAHLTTTGSRLVADLYIVPIAQL